MYCLWLLLCHHGKDELLQPETVWLMKLKIIYYLALYTERLPAPGTEVGLAEGMKEKA
jgi:hypothetical protein